MSDERRPAPYPWRITEKGPVFDRLRSVHTEGTMVGPDDPYYYCTDDYSRDGCTVSIDVTHYGYGLKVFSPSGALLESYACVSTPRAIGRMVEEWCGGCKPRLRDRLDGC